MTDPDFLEDDDPRDGSRSVTSMGAQSAPLHREPVEHSHGSSLATPDLGVHVMDDTEEDGTEEDGTEEDGTEEDGTPAS